MAGGYIYGNDGNDLLYGEAGNDTFQFQKGYGSYEGDVIEDFTEGDKIQLIDYNRNFSAVTVTSDDGLTFVSLQGYDGVLTLTGEIELDAGDFIFS